MGTVRGIYTKHLHCGVRTKGGVRAGRVSSIVPLTGAPGTGGGSMSRTDSLGMRVLHQGSTRGVQKYKADTQRRPDAPSRAPGRRRVRPSLCTRPQAP
ncbi:hypothetical protein CsSME_00015705 [Camellia sinensis var. sinensis]